MDYTQAILTVNSSSIIILILLAFILLIATRFRGESGYAAAIIVVPNVPVYLYNMSRMLGWHDISIAMLPIAFSVNLTLMPLLWLFTLRNFHADFSLRWKHILHFIPAIFCLVYALFMSPAERLVTIEHEMSGQDTEVGNINAILVFVQMVGYYIAIFRCIYRYKRAVYNTESNADWIHKDWILIFQILFASLFVIVMVSYAIWPRTDAWLIQVLNVIAMCYLVYNSIRRPQVYLSVEQPLLQMVDDDTVKPIDNLSLDDESDKDTVADVDDAVLLNLLEQANNYIEEHKSYLRADITLAALASDMGVSQRLLSRAINVCCNYNFFEYINSKRVDHAKQLLLSHDTSAYSIESVYSECGFRSRSTFFHVFKKLSGCTPKQWLKVNKSDDIV